MALTSRSVESTLNLRFESLGGATRLTHRQAGGLSHIGKPYWDGRSLLTQLINPTAGLFSGDRLDAEIQLEDGASVLLTSPSATRLHAMTRGSSEVSQHFRLGEYSWLEVLPDFLIPQAASHGSVRTKIELEPSSSLALLDILAPGRLAHGESLAFRHFASALDISCAGIPLVRERARLTPNRDAWRLFNHDSQAAFVASLWLHLPYHPDLSELLISSEAIFDTFKIDAGATQLAEHFGVIRLLTPCSRTLRTGCLMLREHLAQTEPRFLSRTGKL